MKFFLGYFLVGIGLFSSCKAELNDQSNHTSNNKKTFRLSGHVTFTSDYCGGAAPPEDLLARLATPTSYKGKVFYIRGGETNNLKKPILYTIVTDSLGNYSVDLPPGNYCMIDQFRKDKVLLDQLKESDAQNYLQINDQQCLNDWFNSCFIGIIITDTDIPNMDFNIERHCFLPEEVPCISYIGPYPP